MPRITPLEPPATPEWTQLAQACEQTLGFVPNSVKAMVRVPGLAPGLLALNRAVMGPGRVDAGFKRLVAHMASRAGGCQYCMAHTAAGSQLFGETPQRVEALWSFADSPLFTPAERVALELALAAGSVPNDVSDELFARARAHWSEEQLLEIIAVVSLFGFLNRWNDSLATPLEDHPVAFAEQHLAAQGWQAGKHREPPH